MKFSCKVFSLYLNQEILIFSCKVQFIEKDGTCQGLMQKSKVHIDCEKIESKQTIHYICFLLSRYYVQITLLIWLKKLELCLTVLLKIRFGHAQISRVSHRFWEHRGGCASPPPHCRVSHRCWEHGGTVPPHWGRPSKFDGGA